MKDFMCLAAFAGKVLCMAVFLVALRPQHINTVQETGRSASCHAATQICAAKLVAAVAETKAGQCSATRDERVPQQDC